MLNVKPQYITDDKGKKISVVIPIKDFEALMEELDEIEDIRLYDEAMKNDDGTRIPMSEAFKMIEDKRNVK
jgi:PHD/YefM family antitoxin component YafN of YafNO toxin-antitoxin module